MRTPKRIKKRISEETRAKLLAKARANFGWYIAVRERYPNSPFAPLHQSDIDNWARQIRALGADPEAIEAQIVETMP